MSQMGPGRVKTRVLACSQHTHFGEVHSTIGCCVRLKRGSVRFAEEAFSLRLLGSRVFTRPGSRPCENACACSQHTHFGEVHSTIGCCVRLTLIGHRRPSVRAENPAVCYRLLGPRVHLGMSVQGISAMTRISTIAAAFCLASLSGLSSHPSYAQAMPGVERLYVLNCGEGRRRRHFALVARRERRQVHGFRRQLLPDQAHPGLAAVGHRRHRRDRRHAGRAKAGRCAGDPLEAAEDAREPARSARTSSRPISSLLRFPTAHPDHIGNITMFPQSMLLVQKANTSGRLPSVRRFNPEHPRSKSSEATTTCSETAA